MKVKKIAIGVAFLLLLSVAALPTANSFSGCPESWEVKMPNIKLETYLEVYPTNKLRYMSYDGDVRKGMGYQTFTFDSYYPDLSKYIKSLGPDAVMNFDFEISDNPDFKSKILTKGYTYQIDYTEFNTLYGIPSDPWVRLSLTVEVRSCKPSKFYSNSIQAKNNYTLENLDAYFLAFRKFFYNFKQEDLVRKALVKNYEDLSNPTLIKALLGNEQYAWKTEDDESLNPYTSISFNGLSPMGCLKKAVGRELTKVISFNSLPCKVGVFLHNERAYLVQVMDFEAPTPTVKPTPTPTPSQSGKPAVVTSKKPTPPKKTTITCVKGKSAKNVTAVQPKCPSGYKVKK